MFDPIALPIARFGTPFRAAMIDTRISGADVAKPTTVRPTSIGDTPMFLAVTEAPMTMRSAPQTSKAIPEISAVAYKSIGGDYNDTLYMNRTSTVQLSGIGVKERT
jgi:hypothetical protein